MPLPGPLMGFSFLYIYLYVCLFASLLESRLPNPAQTPSQSPGGWAYRKSFTTTSDWHNTLCRVGAQAKGMSPLPTTPESRVLSEWNSHRREQGGGGCSLGERPVMSPWAWLATSRLYLAGSKSRCKLLLRMFPPPRRRTGLIPSSPESRTKGWRSSRRRSNSTGEIQQV